MAWTALLATPLAQAQDTVCARVKIEIKQELTLERQAFDAEMKISNQLDGAALTQVGVVVKVTDELGVPVPITADPNNLSAKFFLRVSNREGISDVDGTGVVAASSTATINWLLIPAPGSAGVSPVGRKYLVGATLQYTFGSEAHTLDVAPDVITVKPLPLLTLDYFLQQDVIADDPLTPEIEPVEPFTLGVRVRNNGHATAKNLKIDSAQPRIIENNQGLLINFKLTGSYVDDAPAQNTLLINFGDIAPASSKMGRWNMETTLAGKFTEFTARFTHADELGGALTSILQATNPHLLIRDVRVDLPGRDLVRDFLAQDGDVIRVYESDGPDTVVTDRSAVAQVSTGTSPSGNPTWRITIPPTDGFVYLRLPDPYQGTKVLGALGRSDAKQMLSENIWLSKTRNLVAKRWEYWLNLFDVNSPGIYTTEFKTPDAAEQPPQLQFIADRTVREGQQASFIVEASSPQGLPLTLSAAPLPAGARFTQQAQDPQAPTLTRGVFDWTPATGTAGTYLITYTASDGTRSTSRSASVRVETDQPPPGPATPTAVAPAPGAHVPSLRPTLSVQTGTHPQDPTTQVQFELYRDEALTQLIEAAQVDKAADAPGQGGGSVPQPTQWQPATALEDNTPYWWRARAGDGTVHSAWVHGRFFVNLYNDPPEPFNLTHPAPGAEVGEVQPTLSWTHSQDKDGDPLTYSVRLYRDAALSDLVAQADDLPPQDGGTSSWTVPTALTNHATYYWRVIAKDSQGAQTPTPARPFTVHTGNTAPAAPQLLAPGSQSTQADTVLTVANQQDAEGDLITYVFEIDTVNTFDSAERRSSGPVVQSVAETTAWTATALQENRRYWWRVKAQDGRAESAWSVGEFLLNAANDPPPVPAIRNPGDGAWVASLQPGLEAAGVADPEGEAVRYQFQVYGDAGLSQLVTEGSAQSPTLIVSQPLEDRRTYWWRVRALDEHDAASDWSAPAVLYVSTGPYQDPSIAMLSPAVHVMPERVSTPAGERRQVTLRWEGTDLNIEASVALYYGSAPGSYVGEPIVQGLRQAAGTHAGSHVWDVTDLPPGAYHVYAVIHDPRGVGRAYAAGAVVIPHPTPQGSLAIQAGENLGTSEAGGTASFGVRLGSAPQGEVEVLLASSNTREGVPQPARLVFTPQDWTQYQAVTVVGQNDCLADGVQNYQVTAQARALDPHYMGQQAAPVALKNLDNADLAGSTNVATLHICALTLVAETQLAGGGWEYRFRTTLSNSAAVGVGGVSARLTKLPVAVTQWLDDTIVFGAVGPGETGRSDDTVSFRTASRIPETLYRTGAGYKWTVTVLE